MGRNFELIQGGLQEVRRIVPSADISQSLVSPLTPEQFYHMQTRATEELERYEADQRTKPAEPEARHLYIVEGES
jgi:hypothetical protein